MNTFRHSGKLGDIVYALPAVRALGGGIFYVDYLTEYREKPALGLPAAQMMIELLETQDYIQRAELFHNQPVMYDLDRFRHKALPISVFNAVNFDLNNVAGALFGNLVRNLRSQFVPKLPVDLAQIHWDCAGLQGRIDRNKPWITGISPIQTTALVVNKTARYPGNFDWSSLKKYANRAIFLGLESEWQAFRNAYFDLEFYRASSLVEFARVVAGAKLFVGSQSLGLALADAMLVPRVAELWEPSPISLSPIHGYQALKLEIVEAYIGL